MDNIENWIALRDMILFYAVIDYRNALSGFDCPYNQNNIRVTPDAMINDVESFFLSQYFWELYAINGRYLIEQLRQDNKMQKPLKYTMKSIVDGNNNAEKRE